jgi:hypothetical protein
MNVKIVIFISISAIFLFSFLREHLLSFFAFLISFQVILAMWTCLSYAVPVSWILSIRPSIISDAIAAAE